MTSALASTATLCVLPTLQQVQPASRPTLPIRTKRCAAVGRVPDVMKLIAPAAQGLPVSLVAMLARAVSWRSAIFVLAVLAVGSAACQLAEWQRRKTLIAVMKGGMPGTVVIQERGRGGPAMRIEIGCEPKDPTTLRGG
jgi:hypothetical protein